jgi:type IV conjugative transfer system protein TraL
MWKNCPKVIDEPVMIVGLEWVDFVVVLLAFSIVTIILNPFLGVGIAISLGFTLWYAKRDQPPGALIHMLHRLEIWPMRGVFAPVSQQFSPW